MSKIYYKCYYSASKILPLIVYAILVLCSVSQLFAIDQVIKAKYPFVLVGDDYGILTEQGMMDESYGLTLKPLDYNNSEKSGMYWV